MHPKQIATYSLISLAVLTSLIYYNFRQVRQKLSTKQSEFSVELLDSPTSGTVGERLPFKYKVNSSGNFSATSTTIYWGPSASPSALTKYDSPEAVGYPRSVTDYLTGVYPLPETFDLNLVFDKSGSIFYRAYAKIGNDHYWSPEEEIRIAK